MAFCSQCGKKVEDDARFCTACGAKIDTEATAAAGTDGHRGARKASVSYEKFIAYNDTSASYSEGDRTENRLVSVLAYLHILVLVPWIGMRESPFAQYHARVGLNLLIWHLVAEIGGEILISSLKWIPVLGTVITVLVVLVNVLLWSASIFGIVSAARGKARELQIFSLVKFFK